METVSATLSPKFGEDFSILVGEAFLNLREITKCNLLATYKDNGQTAAEQLLPIKILSNNYDKWMEHEVAELIHMLQSANWISS